MFLSHKMVGYVLPCIAMHWTQTESRSDGHSRQTRDNTVNEAILLQTQVVGCERADTKPRSLKALTALKSWQVIVSIIDLPNVLLLDDLLVFAMFAQNNATQL